MRLDGEPRQDLGEVVGRLEGEPALVGGEETHPFRSVGEGGLDRAAVGEGPQLPELAGPQRGQGMAGDRLDHAVELEGRLRSCVHRGNAGSRADADPARVLRAGRPRASKPSGSGLSSGRGHDARGVGGRSLRNKREYHGAGDVLKLSVLSVSGPVRLMRLATAAAPKPLSMLTTATPDAQLFSIDSSAATPPAPAP